MPNPFATRAALTASGFAGSATIASLRTSDPASISPPSPPRTPGVYAVVREPALAPTFLPVSPAGRHKGRDPTVPIETLEQAWVESALVLYIGKAAGEGRSANLNDRLRELVDFGAGRRVPHWSGRYLWQLHNIDRAVVCWRPCENEDPFALESQLLREFIAVYGKPPFANPDP